MEKDKRKNKSQKSKYDLQRMMQEREEFYQGLKEIEQLKLSYSQLIAEDEAREKEEALIKEATKGEVLCSLRVVGDKPPGRENHFSGIIEFYNRDLGKIEKLQLPNGLNYEDLRVFLENNLEINHAITNEALFSLFLLMSLDEDVTVVNSCYELLKKNISTFAPKFHHIINVFLNWGATCESLNITEGEKSEVFRKGIRTKEPKPDFTFSLPNYTKVIDYVGEVCFLNAQCYSKTEKAILLKCLFRLSLDKTFSLQSASISNCIGRVIESFPQWDSFTVANLCRLIHDDKDHFHNQVAIVMNTLPQIKRCNDLLSCVYYNVLRTLVQLQPKYEFPYEDEQIVELVKAAEIDADDSDDLYRLYVLMQLLNCIVYHRNIYNNSLALKEITDKLNELHWACARSARTFDAAFVKGRIMYCCAMWSLSRPLSEQKTNF